MLNALKIAILDDYQDYIRHLACFSLLEGYQVKVFTNSPRGLGQLSVRLAPFDALILIGERTYISEQLMQKLPNLKLVVQVGQASPHIDLAAAAARGITVLAGRDDPVPVAELSWTLIMAASRKIGRHAQHLQEGVWQTCSHRAEHNTPGTMLHGKTLGIWGYGRVGRLVAAYGRAFGMRVMIWGSPASLAAAAAHGFAAAPSKTGLFEEADIVSLHLRLSDSSRACVTTTDLAAMKSTSLLVNTSHAALVAPGALQAALAHGCPGAAALDVFESEPLAADSPWLGMENVLATPRLGWVTKESYQQAFCQAFQALIAFTTRHAG